MKNLDFVYNANDGTKLEILFSYTEGSPATYWEPEEYPEIDIQAAIDAYGNNVLDTLSMNDLACIDQCAYEYLEDYLKDSPDITDLEP